MGEELPARILFELTDRIINGSCGKANSSLGEEERRIVLLRHQLLALFQPGV